ncbi:MAG: 5-guanidino-2-oxopentanoate decarboxylase [Halioglobus sp.]
MATCGEQLVRLLEAYGIEVAFGIPGTHTIELYRGLPSTGIRHVTPRHEQGAGFMADGYARASGKPAACLTVSGPGAYNIATAMGQALQDSVPMLVISADNQRHELGLGEGRLHETQNLRDAMAQCSVWSHTLMRADELPRVLARAFGIFASARPGPVHLSIPQDVITAPADHIDMTPWPLPSRPTANQSAIAQATTLLNEARSPVVALGGGCADAGEDLVALIEALDSPVTLTHNAKGLLPPDHPLLVATSPSLDAVRALYDSADVVLGIGTEFSETDYDFFFNGGFKLTGQVIRIDIDATQLSRNVRPTLAIQSDATAAIQLLLPGVVSSDREGAKRVSETLAAVTEHHAGYQRFLDALKHSLPNCIVMGDSTQPVYFAAAQYHSHSPRSFASAATGYGTLGFSLPASFGARLARPTSPVVALIGDGGLQFTINELATAVEAGISVAIVVWNNERYEMIARNFEAADMTPIACDIYTPDFIAIARGYGCEALRVTNYQELEEALHASVEKNVPTLIEVRETDFLDNADGATP